MGVTDIVMQDIALLGFGEGGWGLFFLSAAVMTLSVTLVAMIIGALIGSVVAWAKLSEASPLRLLGTAYTFLLRGTPELLIIYLVFFGELVDFIGYTLAYFGIGNAVAVNSFLAGSLGVGLISAAYQAEVYRGAYIAISKGEIEAARAIGMPRFMRFRRIVVPQILRFAIPGLGNVWQLSVKDSALVSITGIIEIMNAANKARGSHPDRAFLFLTTAMILYLILTSFSTSIFNAGERHVNKSFRRPART